MGKTIYQKLSQLQQAYSAPKSEYNSFGGYAYRSFETMLDTLKPLLSEFGLVLTTTNKLAECGGHVYVQSICTITDIETGESISSDSYAREDDTRKGMVGAQITGGCVSYSAKYALGLLLSVGTGQRDADSMDNRPQAQNNRPAQPQTRPTPPPQQPMQAPQYQPPMQYTAPPMPPQQTAPQYTTPPMPPQQTTPPAPQYQAPPMPPQQPVTAPPVQQAQQPMQTAPTPPAKPADAPKSTAPFTRKERPAPPISADAQNVNRPPVPAPGQYSTTPIPAQSIPAAWGINEAPPVDDLVPVDEHGQPIFSAGQGVNATADMGFMQIPDGVNEELPFA